MDDAGCARLADFGLAAVTLEFGSAGSTEDGYALRWAAPEILDDERPVSKESDVYSFAMVVIEVCIPKALHVDQVTHRTQGIYREGAISWYSTHHGGGRRFSGKPANATDAHELNQQPLGDD